MLCSPSQAARSLLCPRGHLLPTTCPEESPEHPLGLTSHDCPLCALCSPSVFSVTLTESFVLTEHAPRGLHFLLSLGAPHRQDLVGQDPAPVQTWPLPFLVPVPSWHHHTHQGPRHPVQVVCQCPSLRLSPTAPDLSHCADLRDIWSCKEPRRQPVHHTDPVCLCQ